jgi:CHASE3 domain sensor protein
MVAQSEIDKLLKEIDEVGEVEVRRRLKIGNHYARWKAAYLETELERRERAVSDASQSEQTDIARSARDAAWAAADAAREANALALQANQQAKRANMISIAAIIIAIIAVIVTAVVPFENPTAPKASSASGLRAAFSSQRAAGAVPSSSSSASR